LSSPPTSSPTFPTSSPVQTAPLPPISPIFPTSNPPIYLYPGEVRDYQGENLSSIADVYINAVAGIQYIDQTNYTLTVNGLVNNKLNLSYKDVTQNYQLYKKVVAIHCVEGWEATILWEGFLVKDLVQSANVSSAANTVIFHASDGYTTALPLDYLTKNNIIIAIKMNGLILPPERGFPFELVAESKWGYKWIKWITGIELSNDPSYLGYWESRGYSNDATVP
jgi:DMSO/TMAO reductase YedYZ molybdopterin-dependent catalytic subunit